MRNIEDSKLDKPPVVGEPYVAAIKSDKDDTVLVRTLTDFDAVAEVGTRKPDKAWRVTGYYGEDTQADLNIVPERRAAKPRASVPWNNGYSEQPVSLPLIAGLKKSPGAKWPAEEYDAVCWRALLCPEIKNYRQAAVIVAKYGQDKGEDWTADIAEQYLPIVVQDMKAAGLKPVVNK